MRIIQLSFIFGVLFLGYINQLSQATLVEQARADLAGRLNVAADQIEVLNAEPVKWPDACIGVYRPGQFCAEVITRGSRITLRVHGRDYFYNASDTLVIYAGP